MRRGKMPRILLSREGETSILRPNGCPQYEAKETIHGPEGQQRENDRTRVCEGDGNRRIKNEGHGEVLKLPDPRGFKTHVTRHKATRDILTFANGSLLTSLTALILFARTIVFIVRILSSVALNKERVLASRSANSTRANAKTIDDGGFASNRSRKCA